MEATNKEVIFTRPHKTIYAAGDKIIKVFDERYTKADVLNEARNEALVEENTDLNIPELLEVSHTEEGWCLVREKVEGKTLEQLMKEEPEKLETYMEMFVDLQLDVHKQKVATIKRLRHKLMDQINSLKRQHVTNWLPGWKVCPGIQSSAMVILIQATSLWINVAGSGSLTGRMRHREMRPQMRQ